MCSHVSRLYLHKGSLSLPLTLHCKFIFRSVCVSEDKKRSYLFLLGGRYCVCVCVVSVSRMVFCLPVSRWTSFSAFSVVLHVSWFWFWTRGSDRRLDTLEFVVSSFVTHTSFWSFLTPRHW